MRFIASILILLVGTISSPASSNSDDQPYTVLVMGDSISAAYGLNESDGWVELAEQALLEKGLNVSFVNASISGDTTAGGLQRLPDTLERFNPDLLVIELGGNDGLRGYPPKTIRENLESMAELAQGRGTETLILGMMIPSNYGKAYLQLFEQVFVDAAENSGSSLLPFLLEPIAQDRDYFQADGIHPTAAAQPLLVEHVLPALTEIISESEAL